MNTTFTPGFNPAQACTLDDCSIWQSEYIHYRPSLSGNVLFLGIMSITAVGQLCVGMRYKTGLVCTPMLLGLGCEVLGYMARVLLAGDPFMDAFFMIYLLCLILGPAFMAAAMYLCFRGMMVAYGEEISRLRAIVIVLLFMGGDVFNLVVQSVGGRIDEPMTGGGMIELSTRILMACLSLQAATLFAFSWCSLDFRCCVDSQRRLFNPKFAELYDGNQFKGLVISLSVATACLFARTVVRCVELSGSFSRHLVNSGVDFMVLEGGLVIIACTCLTAFHPGIRFEKGWTEAQLPSGWAVVKGDLEAAEEHASKELDWK